MLTVNLSAIAKQILEESKYDPQAAESIMIERVNSDASLRGAIIHEGVSSLIRAAASQQRTNLVRRSQSGIDDARGLALIAKEGYLDTYLLLNSIRLGDAKDEELSAAIADTYSREKTLKAKRQFLEAIRKSPKMKKGKRVRDCFTDLEVARLAGDFKC
jgi:hypothetical protein